MAQVWPLRFPAAPQCQPPEGRSGLEVAIGAPHLDHHASYVGTDQIEPRKSLPLPSPKSGTTHRLPTVALGSRWSRAALQKIRGSETPRLGSSF